MMGLIPEEKLWNKKILIFDFDGTVANTSPLHARAFQETLGPQGISVDYTRLAGLKTADAILLCYRDSGLVRPDRGKLGLLIREKQSRVRALIESDLQPLPGVAEFLYWAKPLFKLALVTSGSRGTVTIALKKLGLNTMFSPMVFSEDVSQSKPNPEGFLRALEIAEVRASEALVIEDSQVGFEAARRCCIDVVSPTFST